MKVRFTLEARGKLKVDFDEPLVMENCAFNFMKDPESGYVREISIEISEVPQEKWPTLTRVPPDPDAKIPRFPFETNRNALNFWAIQSQFLSLESYLSVFGLASLAFETVREEWVHEPHDPNVSMQGGISMRPGDPKDIAPPLSKEMISRCIASSSAARVTEIDTLFLSYYRVAQINMQNRLYVDAFRYSYLCLECLFANRKFRKNQVLSEFSTNKELGDAIDEIFLQKNYKSFEAIRGKYPRFLATKSVTGICEFLIDLRGKLQHANTHVDLAWHPSKQYRYEKEALCIFSIADTICYNRTLMALRSISSGMPL